MSLRSWATCALFVAMGCATGGDAPPRRAANSPAAASEGVADEDAPEAAPVAKKEAPEPEPPPVAKEAPPPAPAAPDASEPKRTTADPFGDVGFKEVNQKDWLAGLRETLAKQEKVPPTDLRVSPGMLRAAYVRSPPVVAVKPGRKAPARRHDVVVVDNQGRRVASFRAVAAKRGDEPPKDLRFLSEERLVYEVVEPPPEPEPPGKAAPHQAPPHAKSKPKAKAAVPAPTPHVALAPLPPPRTFVIQPIAPRARPIKCVGVHFTFTKEKDRLAFVSGTAEAGFVAVDGAQVYPRRGRTIVASAPAWSKDGRSLAFVEAHAAQPARLVLVAEVDNATGDTTWDLPPTAPLEGVGVFWAGSGKLVVGKTQMRPVFSASFTKESAGRGP